MKRTSPPARTPLFRSLPTRLAALCAALFLFVGQAASAEHNPVIFLHGWNSDGSIWKNMMDLMVENGWEREQLLAPSYLDSSLWKIETLGYGSNDQPIPIIAEGLLKQTNVVSFLEKYKGKTIDFVVHSMGGLILRQMVASKKLPASRIGRVVDLATPHFGQWQDAGRSAEDMKYGSEFLWTLNWAWHTNNSFRIPNFLCVAGVDSGSTYSGKHDNLVNQWSAVLGLEWTMSPLFVNKTHTNIHNCPSANDPVWKITKKFLEDGNVLSQSECGASVPSEGGAIFLQVVDSSGKPISWQGRMIASVKKSSGEDVEFYEHHGEKWHTFGNVFSGGGTSMQTGIALLTTQINRWTTFKGFDRGFYDIEFLPSSDSRVGSFTCRGVEVLWNRTTLLQITPPTRLMVGICIDCSGSMQGERIANAIASAQRTIDKLPAGTFVAVLKFESSAKVIQPFVEIRDNANGTSNRAIIKTLIGNISASGGTDILGAGNKMLSEIQAADTGKTAVRSMILLTDGEDSNFTENKDSFVRACNEAGVSFNAIAYGSAADAESLTDVAKRTRGSHFESGDSAAELDIAFERTVTDILNKATLVDWVGSFASLSNPTTTGQGIRASKPFRVDSSTEAIHIVSTVAAGYTVTLRDQSTGRSYPGTVREDENGRTYTFDVSKPTRGTWSLDVVKTSTASVDGPVSVMVTAPTPATTSAPSLTLDVHSTENALRATVRKGGLVRRASVFARCRLDGLYVDFPMVEESPGVYYLDLLACGDFQGGLVVSAEAVAGTATIVETDDSGAAITPLRISSLADSFTRAKFLNISKIGDGGIRDVAVRPRWPWEGKVDIDFEAAAIDKNTVLSIGFSGIDADTGNTYVVQTITCDENPARVSPGKHRVTWNAAADVPNADIANFSVRIDATTAKALENATGVTASAGTYFDGVHVAWNAVANATHYRVYRSESASETSMKTLLTTTTGRTYVDSSAVAEKKYYYYWVQPLVTTSSGTVKHEGGLAVSGGGWNGSLGTVSSLSASRGTHFDGVHLTWTEPAILKNYPTTLILSPGGLTLAGADSSTLSPALLGTGQNVDVKYNVYRSTSSSSSTKKLLATTTATSYVDTGTTASQSANWYYYWVEPVATISSATYTGKLNATAASGWRNKLGTPSFHFENWQPGPKDRPIIDLIIDGDVSGATQYEFMSGDQEKWWTQMDQVVNGTRAFSAYGSGKGTIAASASPKKALIGWAFGYRYELRVYVRASNSEGTGNWVKWDLADHLNESEFKNSAFYKRWPK